MIFQLIILSYLMFFVANVQEYDSDNYNCHHHALLLTEMLQDHGFEAYYRSGWVTWDRRDDGSLKCCHAWTDVVMFGKNWTIETTTGHIVKNQSQYMPAWFQENGEPPK